MTAFGKQIIVLAGEPSSAPRDPVELSLAFILDTGKIRYPNDQQIQQTPSGERVQGNRRPSAEQTNRGAIGSVRPVPRDASEETQRRMTREPAPAVQPPAQRLQDQAVGNAAGSLNGGSRLPRASNTQGPPGPPPPGQAPQPKINGAGASQRSKTPPVTARAVGSSLDSVRPQGNDKENVSPSTQEPKPREQSPGQSGRFQPNGSTSTRQAKESFEGSTGEFSRSSSRSKRQQPSQDSEDFGIQRPSTDEQSNLMSRDMDGPSKNVPVDSGVGSSPALSHQHDELVKELEAVRNKNAWYASELALARKAGYSPSENQNLDDRGADAFGDDDRPLVEALLKMRNELSRIQSAIDTQSGQTASKIAEVEKQRDNAINEAVYAKAKLVAHGGSVTSTPQPDGSRGMSTPEGDRSNEMNRRLASSIAAQTELSRKLDGLIQELDAEKRAREIAEDTATAAQQRVGELDLYRQHNASEVESLRSDLHEAQRAARQESANATEALASSKMLAIDKTELSTRLDTTLEDLKTHTMTLDSLHKAVNASTDKAAALERKLEDETNTRNMIEQTLAKLRTQHDEKTTELEGTRRKLQDAEEMAEKHALEASTHREAVLAGLNNIRSSRSVEDTPKTSDERVTLLRQQVDNANDMAKRNQEAADQVSEKLRRAEERIAGLESYQEQTSRESLSIRKQLQSALKDVQNHHAQKAELQQQLASQQLETNAIAVQHGALREILAERGMNSSDSRRSRGLDSPNSMTRFGTPEMNRMRELEQQLEASMRAHEDMKSTFEAREQEVGREWEEKLAALDNDHQAAVKYLRGTERMLSKMKQELQRYKSQNTELEKELAAQKSGSARGLDIGNKQLEEERASLQQQLRDMEARAQESLSSLEAQMSRVQDQLALAQRERDDLQESHRSSQLQLSAATDQHTKDVDGLRRENQHLEARAQDAEQKVQLLLDQVESSVDNYRRQSQQMLPNGTSHASHHHHPSHQHRRGVSTATIDSLTSPISPHSGPSHAGQPGSSSQHWAPGHHAADSLGGDSVYSSSSTATTETAGLPRQGTSGGGGGGSDGEGSSPVDNTRN
ncbi:MAG: hypothetical protein Q9157_007322, partial [Trypethelium eluteriae]